jgi:hypothetical protein
VGKREVRVFPVSSDSMKRTVRSQVIIDKPTLSIFILAVQLWPVERNYPVAFENMFLTVSF